MEQSVNGKMRKQKVKCSCGSSKHKIVFTNGRKSRGYKICKKCGGIIKND